MRTNFIWTLFAGLAVVAACVPAVAQPDAGIRFRGVGATRAALDAMQLKPFDQALWAELSDWAGEPVKADATEGKVVLIVTWAGWHRTSHPAVKAAEALYEKHKDQGLIVVGVHNPRGFENAATVAKELNVSFPYAADKDGKFRTGVRADLDPNIYLIDRSGNLRYAQIETASLDDAVSRLLAESAEQARDLPKVLADRNAAKERDKWKTSASSSTQVGMVDVAFNAPEEDAYKAVKWPFIVGKVEKDEVLEKIHNDPPKLAMPNEEEWIPGQPKRGGRIVVMYFIDPKDADTLRVIPVMNAIQDQYRRDVVVVGAVTAPKTETTDDEKHRQRNRELLNEVLAGRSVNHWFTPKVMKADKLELGDESLKPRLSNQRDTFGFALTLSTDDKIRWLGTPYSEELRRSLDRIIALDPAVQARRKAEDAKRGK